MKKSYRFFLLALFLLLCALALAACGSGDDDTTTTASQTTLPATTTASSAVTTAPPVTTAPVPEGSEGLFFESYGDGTCYVSEIGNCTDADVVIPAVSPDGDTVIEIGAEAFNSCTDITSVTIPDTVLYIGDQAFFGCIRLESVVLPDSIAYIGESAFVSCFSLAGVYIGDLAAFCEIEFENYSANPVSVSGKLYLDGALITRLLIPEGVTELLPYAFAGCESLTYVELPASVSSIGDCALADCSGITDIRIGEGVVSIERAALQSCSGLLSVTIPDSVKRIGEQAFAYCTSLSSVTVGDGVEEIGMRAFFNCRITEASIPTSAIRAIPPEHLEAVSITGGRSIESDVFRLYRSLTSVIIGDSVEEIGEGAFQNCSALLTVIIGDSVRSIGENAFLNCPLIYEEDGIYYADLWAVGCDPSIAVANLREDTAGIADAAFANRTLLTSVTVPDLCLAIGDRAFYGCSVLSSVSLPASLTEIGARVFDGCTAITLAEMPTLAIPAIPQDRLQSVVIVGGEEIGSHAFYNCKTLISITIADTVTVIGERAFFGCTSLLGAVIPAHAIAAIPKAGLLTVTITSGEEIENSAFRNCTSLASVSIAGSVRRIGYVAFEGCTALRSATFLVSEGWLAEGVPISEESLAIPSVAAVCLTATHCLDSWVRQ